MKRPKVVLQVTSSIDGRISFTPGSTMFTPLHESLKPFQTETNNRDWKFFHESIRSLHQFDFFLEGCNMLVSETESVRPLPQYSGNKETLYRDYLPEAVVNRKGRKTWTSVVDGMGRFRNAYKAFTDNPDSYMIHLTSYNAPPEYLAFLQKEEIPYLLTGNDKVDLTAMFDKLYRVLNVRTILTSSGGKLAGALIRENLLDEINILFNPVVYGGSNNPVLFSSPDINPPFILPNKLKYISSHVFESGSIWMRYEVINH